MKVVMYLRISNEDTDVREKSKCESNSIAHQRWMLTDFVRNHPDLCDAELDEICDDGWSGRSFERPGMTELLERVKRGAVQCIVVKDFSRFGRDYLTVGNYISRVFPFMGVRFISVNDSFDSTRPGDIDSLDTSFKTLIYDLYSRELSQKVKAAKKQRAEQGLFLSTYAPYGYVKDSSNKNHLVVDEPAAEIVRRIFQMALDGYSTREIAFTLNQEGVITPMRYKRSMGVLRNWRCVSENNFWTSGNVGTILRDQRYVGTIVNGKSEQTNVGHHNTVLKDREDWIICENKHEAIISKTDFDSVQALFAQRAKKIYSAQGERPLKGKVFCGICGHAMRRSSKPRIQYRCSTHFYTDEYPCTGHGTDEADIFDAILEAIHYYARLAVQLDNINTARQKHVKLEKKNIGKKLTALQNEKLRLDGSLQELYEHFADGELSRETYLLQKSSITERVQQITDETSSLEQSMTDSSDEQSEVITKYIGYAEIEALTSEIIDELVNRVNIYSDNVLEVQLNFSDELESLQAQLNEAG
ncbi:MAG: recombinase family protein [Oscillospiraceae bacterium]|nr:recombinase family protein [Oscillospiraceae bacterium]